MAEVEPLGAAPPETAETAVPPRDTVCGEFRASSENVSVAVRWPGAMGLKTTEMVQLAEGASAEGQLFVKLKSEGFGPPRETEEMCRVMFPVLKTVSIWGVLEVPSVTAAKGGAGNDNEDGEKPMADIGAAPVPLRARVWGLPGALSET